MILVARFLSCCVALLFGCHASGQNLFDAAHTRRYADYLFRSAQFEQAAAEYERLLFLDDTDSVRAGLLASYRRAIQPAKGLIRLESLYPDKPSMPFFAAREYLNLLMMNGLYQKADSSAGYLANLDVTERRRARLHVQMLESRWREAATSLLALDTALGDSWPRYDSLVKAGLNQRYKNSALAAGLSAVVPGLGKVYSRNWKDGLVSLIFVGGLGFQSYRAFRRDGASSIPGWLLGGMGVGFYIGNIYGTVRETKKYNRAVRGRLHQKSRHLALPAF